MKEAYIYTYVNKITNKTYIGSRSFYKTSAYEDFNHKYKSSSKNKDFLADMKAGLLEGQIILIINCDNSKRKIVEIEHLMIQAYWKKFGKENSYNCYCNGKFSMAGYHHTEIQKRKWSKNRKGENSPMYGKHLTEEQKAHLRTFRGEKASMFGKHKSQETREKLSKALKGRIFSEETRQKISKANKGKHISKETKLKISDTLKGRKFSEETILKMKSHTGKNHHAFGKKLTEEHKRKCSEALKGRKHTEETKRKIKNSLTGKTKIKYNFIDLEGNIHLMDKRNAKKWHPDWIQIE